MSGSEPIFVRKDRGYTRPLKTRNQRQSRDRLEYLRFSQSLGRNTYGTKILSDRIWRGSFHQNAFRNGYFQSSKSVPSGKTTGKYRNGKIADIVVLTRNIEDPYTNLCESDLSSVRLVLRDGLPVYGDVSLESFFEESGAIAERIRIDNIERYLVASPGKLLESIAASLGYKKDLAFFPVQKEFDNFG